MRPDGSCPTCGRALAAIPPADPDPARKVDVKALAGEKGKVPWHFKVLVVALTLYLTWRVVQLVLWAAS
jgi:hypothetical protein